MNLHFALATFLLAAAATPAAAEGEPAPAAPSEARVVQGAPPSPAAPPPSASTVLDPVAPAPPPRSLFGGSDGGWALLGRIGTFIPTLGEFKALQAATAVEVGLRRRVGTVLALELGAGYSKAHTDTVIQAAGEYGPEEWSRAELTVAPMTAAVRAAYRAGPAELFASVGGGVYWCQLYKRASAPPLYYGASSDEFQPGLFIATGTGFRFTPALTVSYEVRYTYLEPQFFGIDSRVDGLGLTVVAAYGF